MPPFLFVGSAIVFKLEQSRIFVRLSVFISEREIFPI